VEPSLPNERACTCRNATRTLRESVEPYVPVKTSVPAAGGLRVGIDIGGTFTDLVALDAAGTLTRIKLASTPKAPETGFLAALDRLLAETAASEIELVAHASTIATNALLGQMNLTLPRVAFVTTAGFRDVLEIGRQNRSAIYDLGVTRPRPLARREDRLVVRERRTHTGDVLEPLDPDDVARVVATIAERGIASVAIGFLHADVDGAHERAMADALRSALPDIDVSLSSEIDPQYREFERFSTTVVNAALGPIVRVYLERIAAGLRERDVLAPAFIMRSDGGMTALEHAACRPAALIESGPASGVIAAAFVGRALGIENVLSFDMGGTTAKAGTIVRGTPAIGTSYEAAGGTHSGRAVRGSGYPVRFPFVDLAEVSAGGGTLAWVDRAGALRVGPHSAGADPGPAAYGIGGRPTVTDANLVLGRLNPDALLGGAFPISVTRAYAAVAGVARPLDGDVLRTAAGIVTLVDHEMAKVLRIVSVERGYDPRDFTLLAFGGSGPLHACAVASEVGMTRIIVPPQPGVFSAYGLLAADVRAVAVRSFVEPARDDAFARVSALFEALTHDVDAALAAQAVAPERRRFARELDLRYAGQLNELSVGDVTSLVAARAAFHRKHRERYGFAVEEEPVEIVTVRAIGIGTTHKPALAALPRDAGSRANRRPAPESGVQRVAFDGTHSRPMPVYARTALHDGENFRGPAIVEQYDATTYVAPGWHALVDAQANLHLERSE